MVCQWLSSSPPAAQRQLSQGFGGCTLSSDLGVAVNLYIIRVAVLFILKYLIISSGRQDEEQVQQGSEGKRLLSLGRAPWTCNNYILERVGWKCKHLRSLNFYETFSEYVKHKIHNQ